jgi:hypothetical protein
MAWATFVREGDNPRTSSAAKMKKVIIQEISFILEQTEKRFRERFLPFADNNELLEQLILADSTMRCKKCESFKTDYG